MTVAYQVVCSRDVWCRSDNDRHRFSTEAGITWNAITLGLHFDINAFALTGGQVCPGGRVHVSHHYFGPY